MFLISPAPARAAIDSIVAVGKNRAWDKKLEQGETLKVIARGHGIDFASSVSAPSGLSARITDKRGLVQGLRRWPKEPGRSGDSAAANVATR